jgi:hypothetical protein
MCSTALQPGCQGRPETAEEGAAEEEEEEDEVEEEERRKHSGACCASTSLLLAAQLTTSCSAMSTRPGVNLHSLSWARTDADFNP